VEFEKPADSVAGPHTILLECDEHPDYLTVFPPFLVRNITQSGDIVVFQDEGQSLCISLVRLHSVDLGFRDKMGRNDNAVDAVNRS